MKSNENQRLTPRQLQVIPHILACSTYEEAAKRAKITSKQIYEWLLNPTFKEELTSRRTEAYCHALSTLKTSSLKAVQTLISLLDNEDPRIRLSASDKVLAHTLKGVEYLGFEERLSEIESQVDRALKAENKG